MTSRTTAFSGFAALLLAAAPLPVLAQASPPAPVLASATPQSQVQAATEQRISGLQAQLAITPAQTPDWNAVAQVMRDNAQATDALFRQRAAGASSMNAIANLKSYAQISRAYADGTEKLAATFDTLYATLSDPQKQIADTLFQQQATAGAQPRPRR